MTTSVAYRIRGRNYFNERGREVYYRTADQKLLRQKKGQFGSGPEGWSCCSCARLEDSCVCPPRMPNGNASIAPAEEN